MSTDTLTSHETEAVNDVRLEMNITAGTAFDLQGQLSRNLFISDAIKTTVKIDRDTPGYGFDISIDSGDYRFPFKAVFDCIEEIECEPDGEQQFNYLAVFNYRGIDTTANEAMKIFESVAGMLVTRMQGVVIKGDAIVAN